MFDNEKQVQELINELQKTDEQFAVAMTNKAKSMEGFMQYFFQCAQAAYIKTIGRTNGYMSSIGEDDVRSLMVHYWTEDNPKVGDIELGSAKFAKVETPKADKPKAKPAAPATPKGKVPATKKKTPAAKAPTPVIPIAPKATVSAPPPAPKAPQAKATSTNSVQAPPVVGFCDDDDFDID